MHTLMCCSVSFLPTRSTLDGFNCFTRVAERFIRHIVGFYLFVFRILNKLLSVPKTNCVLFVSGPSWGISHKLHDLIDLFG